MWLRHTHTHIHSKDYFHALTNKPPHNNECNKNVNRYSAPVTMSFYAASQHFHSQLTDRHTHKKILFLDLSEDFDDLLWVFIWTQGRRWTWAKPNCFQVKVASQPECFWTVGWKPKQPTGVTETHRELHTQRLQRPCIQPTTILWLRTDNSAGHYTLVNSLVCPHFVGDKQWSLQCTSQYACIKSERERVYCRQQQAALLFLPNNISRSTAWSNIDHWQQHK